MPFTAAHAIIGLPVTGRWSRRLPEALRVWVVAALVLGAMVPDAPLFLDVLWPGADELAVGTHRWGSVLTVDLLLTLGLTASWVLVVRGPWLAALPRRLPTRRTQAREARPDRDGDQDVAPIRSLVAVAAVVGAAILGLLTHMLWDDLTHLRGGAVQAWAFLREPVAGTALYKYLQHGSSAAGVLVLLVAACVWWRRALPVPHTRLVSLVVSVVAGASVGMVGAAFRIQHDGGQVTVYSLARLAATFPVLGAVLGLVVWAVVVRASAPHSPRSSRGGSG